jgi:hypothetical protein
MHTMTDLKDTNITLSLEVLSWCSFIDSYQCFGGSYCLRLHRISFSKSHHKSSCVALVPIPTSLFGHLYTWIISEYFGNNMHTKRY